MGFVFRKIHCNFSGKLPFPAKARPERVSALVKGDYVACDAEALCAIARIFDAKEENFTPLALRHLLSHSDRFRFLLKKNQGK